MFMQYWWLFHEININEEIYSKIVHIFRFNAAITVLSYNTGLLWHFPVTKQNDLSINSHLFSWSFSSVFELNPKLLEKYWFAQLSFSRSVDYFSLNKALLRWLFSFFLPKKNFHFQIIFLNTGFANFNFFVFFTDNFANF